MVSAIIELENITKKFRIGSLSTQALSNINLRIDEGEFVALMGPSGCGKSTLLNILGLLDRPTQGKLLLGGKDVYGFGKKTITKIRRENIGFIFQGFNLLEELTILQNVALPLKYRGVKKEQREKIAREVLEKVELSHRAEHNPSKISGGQQQRAAIARALAVRPAIVLADEPTGSLDANTGRTILEMLKDMNKEGTTLIMVTHSMSAAAYSDHIISLENGKILEQ